MKAMILAAGKGTRLQPLTNSMPKALVPVNGIPILEIIIKRLISFGFTEIIINVHYLAEQIQAFLRKNKNFNIKIELSDETNLLLDTGGGLKKAAWFFDDGQPFLLHNVDILSNTDLKKMYQYHQKIGSLATLSVEERDSSRKLQFNKDGNLCAWLNNKTGEKKIARPDQPYFLYAFNGIHMINPKIFDLINEEGVFSIIDLYLRLAKNDPINFFHDPNTKFIDIGTPEQLKKAESFGQFFLE
jgi:NDP-sugar pyrophosphorylase family protein